MPSNLFFVDSIYRPEAFNPEGESHQEMKDEVYVSLISTEGNGNESQVPFVVALKSGQLQMKHKKGEIQEGWYVYYTPNEPYEGKIFSYGNQASYARKQKQRSAELRRSLISNNTIEGAIAWTQADLDNYEHHCKVISYHVNVGHGNCSFILILKDDDYDLWTVDCSRFERALHFDVDKDKWINWIDHKSEIDKCLDEIACTIEREMGKETHRSTLRISHIFLTHTHYDHYNGIEYLQSEGYIHKDTVFYLNAHYECASTLMNNILEKLKKDGNKIVEPITSNGSDIIEILHPECRIVRSSRSKIDSKPKPRIVSKVNNSSVVYRINLGLRSMTFPGDLEQAGFDNMKKNGQFPICCETFYYVVSHHGSANGHPKWFSGHKRLHRRCLWCLDCAIVMGRDGAYSGIYSPQALNSLSRCIRVVFTEKDDHNLHKSFFCLNWDSSYVEYK